MFTVTELCETHLILFWHVPLRVCIAKCWNQSSEWSILSFFIQGEVTGFQVLPNSLKPRYAATFQWSPQVVWEWGMLRSFWHLIHRKIKLVTLDGVTYPCGMDLFWAIFRPCWDYNGLHETVKNIRQTWDRRVLRACSTIWIGRHAMWTRQLPVLQNPESTFLGIIDNCILSWLRLWSII